MFVRSGLSSTMNLEQMIQDFHSYSKTIKREMDNPPCTKESVAWKLLLRENEDYTKSSERLEKKFENLTQHIKTWREKHTSGEKKLTNEDFSLEKRRLEKRAKQLAIAQKVVLALAAVSLVLSFASIACPLLLPLAGVSSTASLVAMFATCSGFALGGLVFVKMYDKVPTALAARKIEYLNDPNFPIFVNKYLDENEGDTPFYVRRSDLANSEVLELYDDYRFAVMYLPVPPRQEK